MPTPQSVTSALPQQSQTKASTPVPHGTPSVHNATPVNELTSSSPVSLHPPSFDESMNGPKPNGFASTESARDRQQAKRQQKRDREKERKKDERERETTDKKDLPMSAHQPKPSTSSSLPSGGDGELTSPVEGTGARTPTGPPRRQRHPWTLFMKLPVPTTEAELKEFFQDAKDGVRFLSFEHAKTINSPVHF